MGGFYGSIHFRNIDRAALLRETTNIASSRKMKFLVGPELQGWSAVYPEGHGQDESVAAELAEALGSSALHLLVHDDDIFAYGFYRGSKLIDEFNSCPEYFGNVSAAKKARPRGNLATLADFLAPEADLTAATALIAEGKRFTFEVDRLQQFAELLGIPNAVTSYEYLLGGEHDEITGWADFVPVPDNHAQERVAAETLEKKKSQWKAEGTLLADLREPRGEIPNAFPNAATWCIDPREDRLWLIWTDHIRKTPIPLFTWSPGNDSATPTDRNMPATTANFQISPSGKWLAVGNAYGNWTAELWDWESHTQRYISPHARSVDAFVFLAGESRLLQVGSGEVALTSIPDGARVAVNGNGLDSLQNGVTVHPSGQFLVAAGEHGQFEIIDADTLHPRKTVATHRGMTSDLSQLPALLARLQSEGLSPREIQSAIARSANPEHFKAFAFTADGQLLCAGSNFGLRVYRWVELLAADENTSPTPLYSVEARPHHGAKNPLTYCYTVAMDDPGSHGDPGIPSSSPRVLFAGLEGIIESLDLTTGRVVTLLDPPERLAITRIALSANRQFLVMSAHEMRPNSRREPELTVWNYPALRAKAE